MRENAFGFEYSWADLQPVRALAVTALITQVIGAIAGVAALPYPDMFLRLWVGGAAATLPGYLLGLAIQRHLKPISLSENRVMVRRMGLVAGILSLSAFVVPVVASHAG